jgi:hypothetical protein
VQDGTAAAQALRIYNSDYLHWLLDSYRGLPDGPAHGEALGLYPQPFPWPTSVEGLDNGGAREVVLAACRAAGVDLADLPPKYQHTVAGTYLAYHLEHWHAVLATRSSTAGLRWASRPEITRQAVRRYSAASRCGNAPPDGSPSFRTWEVSLWSWTTVTALRAC